MPTLHAGASPTASTPLFPQSMPVTRLFNAWLESPSDETLGALWNAIYPGLRSVGRRLLRGNRRGDFQTPSDLVQQAGIRLCQQSAGVRIGDRKLARTWIERIEPGAIPTAGGAELRVAATSVPAGSAVWLERSSPAGRRAADSGRRLTCRTADRGTRRFDDRELDTLVLVTPPLPEHGAYDLVVSGPFGETRVRAAVLAFEVRNRKDLSNALSRWMVNVLIDELEQQADADQLDPSNEPMAGVEPSTVEDEAIDPHGALLEFVVGVAERTLGGGDALAARRRRALALLLLGHSTADIAAETGVSLATAKIDKAAILHALTTAIAQLQVTPLDRVADDLLARADATERWLRAAGAQEGRVGPSREQRRRLAELRTLAALARKLHRLDGSGRRGVARLLAGLRATG